MRDISFLKKNLIAHRGVHNKKVIENTKEAFKKAIDNNYPIELDIHITKDNEIIVFHDDNLKRLTNVDKKIKDCTLKELKRIKILNCKEKIPTLEEVLKLVQNKVPLIIEIKNDAVDKIEDKLVEIMDNYEGEFAIKSFSPKIMLNIKNRRPNYIRGLLISNTGIRYIEKFKNLFKYKKLDLDFLSVSKKGSKGRFIKLFRIPKLIWTITTDEEYKEYKDKGYNLICENIETFER